LHADHRRPYRIDDICEAPRPGTASPHELIGRLRRGCAAVEADHASDDQPGLRREQGDAGEHDDA
jgi:hypothetical protein